VERTHRELRARFADRLSSDYADSFTNVDARAARKVAAVAGGAGAIAAFAGEHRPDEDLVDAGLVDRGGNVFVGYLGLEDATAETIDADGWLQTGDVGELDAAGNLRVVDRKKELIVTSGGKNISPANLEAALRTVPLIAQACVVGDERPYVAALLTLDQESSAQWAERRHLAVVDPFRLSEQPELIAEIEEAVDNVMQQFSNPERVKRILILPDEWTVDSALLTPTLKLRRKQIVERYASEIENLYAKDPSDTNKGSAS
jgi:long-chain acyl-CoA synthetase